jgi:alkaline phosphatase
MLAFHSITAMAGQPTTSRRTFLQAASVTSALFGAPAALLAQGTRTAGENRGTARHIIFMVSDGMNHGALSLAQHIQSIVYGQETHWTRLYRERPVVRCLAETFSANSVVTDSAAAASAWGSGRRCNNGALNITRDGQQWAPLQTKLKQARIATGLVSTATITHATPAGFAVNVDSRGKEAEIAAQYLERQVPLLLGGGTQYFDDALLEKYRAAGYDVCRSRDELRASAVGSAKPVLGLFAKSHLPYTIDHVADDKLRASVPTLAEMAQFAVQRLAAQPNDGTFLMIEGARVDHAGHANDAGAILHEQLAFDDAVGAMMAHVAQRDDTLLIVTTDHGCGGIHINGISAKVEQTMDVGIYGSTNDSFRRIIGAKRSIEWMKKEGGGLSGPPLRDFIKTHLGLELSDDDVKGMQGFKGVFAGVLAKYHGLNWTSGNHTGELVEFCATGPGSQHFPPFVRNYEVHGHLLQAFGLA